MKRLAILLVILLPIISLSQTITYLKVADKADYELYKKYCNDTIIIDIVQYGKATIVDTKTSGVNYEMYKVIAGKYTNNLLKDTVWYVPWKYGTKVATRTYGTNDYAIQRVVKCKVLKRVASIDDYYKNRAYLIYK